MSEPSKKKGPQKKRLFLTAYRKLYEHIGERRWWPAKSPFEMMTGAILTQNTSWNNAAKAIENLRQKGMLDPKKMEKCRIDTLAQLIRSSGYYTQKAYKLKALLKWFSGYDYKIKNVRDSYPQKGEALRKELLSIHGVGPETADSILCYALALPYFVVDAYTIRWADRYILQRAVNRYETLRAKVEKEFGLYFKKAELVSHFNEFHALLVYLGKHFCTKREPVCGACPLQKSCAQKI